MLPRWAAVCVLAGFVAAPALRVWCEIDCARGGEAPTTTAHSCHKSALAPAPISVRGADACGDHSPALATLTARGFQRGASSSLLVTPAIDPHSTAPLANSQSRYPVSPRGSTSPPISPGTDSLRI